MPGAAGRAVTVCVALVIATATPAAPTPGTRPLLPERPPAPRVHGADFCPGPMCVRCLCCFLSAPRGTHGSPFSGEGAGQGTPPSLSPPSACGGDGSPCSRFSRGPDVAAPVRPWAGAGCVLSPSHPARPLSAARRWGRGPADGSGFLSPPVWVQPLSFRLLSLSAALGGSSRSTAPAPAAPPAPRPGRVLSVIWASPADPRHLFCPHPRLSVMQGVAGPFLVVITPARQETEAGGERGPGWLRGGASLTCVVAAGGPAPCLLCLVLRQPSQGSCLLLDGRSGGRGLAAPGVGRGCSCLPSASRPPP